MLWCCILWPPLSRLQGFFPCSHGTSLSSFLSTAIYSEPLDSRKLTFGMQSDLDPHEWLVPIQSQLKCDLCLLSSLLVACFPAHPTNGKEGDTISRYQNGISRERCNDLEEEATQIRNWNSCDANLAKMISKERLIKEQSKGSEIKMQRGALKSLLQPCWWILLPLKHKEDLLKDQNWSMRTLVRSSDSAWFPVLPLTS